MHTFFQFFGLRIVSPSRLVTCVIATLLIMVGLAVIASWHAPTLLAPIYPHATLMAYNTAIGFIACGIGLLSILYRRLGTLLVCSALLITIGLVTLVDLLTGFELHTTDWFVIMLSELPVRHQPISPTTSTIFLLAGAALGFGFAPDGNRSVLASLLCLLIIFVACAALLGQGYGLLPHFIWLGIKMAPHTIIGVLAFSAALLSLRYQAAINAFNRLNFFNRLVTGFIFISLLFIGIGSIAMLQINSVASISQKLYSGPLQLSNAALRIKAAAGQLNRIIKDIAVNPELAQERNLAGIIAETETIFKSELLLMEEISQHSADLIPLEKTFSDWQLLLQHMQRILLDGNIDAYRKIALGESQNTTIELERLCDVVVTHTQAQIHSLNEQALTTRDHAANLMQVVILGFLLVGIIVAALITRSLSSQLQKIRETMQLLAQGNTQVAIPFLDHPRDIGEMAKTLEVFAQNINERNKSTELLSHQQQALEKINAQLSQTNKELETFAYVASHDLKSPLRGIAQLSTWIDEDLLEQNITEVNKHTLMLRNRIQRMEKLLDDLLIYYRAGKIDGSLVQINVAQMANELFDIQNTKPGLRLECIPPLPVFNTLSTPFEQILRNLFSNAIKHHDRNEGVISIRCHTLPNGFYEFSVGDDGPGIPVRFQQRVFGMFQTLKPRDELEGSGMGLALIEKIVAAYGGSIKVHSEGRGCSFIFTWPTIITKEQTDE